MTPAEVGAAYDQLAHQWGEDSVGSYGFRQLQCAIRFVTQCGQALDVGCGAGRCVRLLTEHGFSVVGVDVSPTMISLARSQHPGVSFTQADICQWPVPSEINLIVAWDSLWHVPLAQQELVLRKLCGALASGGVLVFTTGGLDAPAEKRDACMGPPMYYSVLGIPRTLAILADCDCILRHLEFDQHPEPHLLIVAQKK